MRLAVTGQRDVLDLLPEGGCDLAAGNPPPTAGELDDLDQDGEAEFVVVPEAPDIHATDWLELSVVVPPRAVLPTGENVGSGPRKSLPVSEPCLDCAHRKGGSW